MRVLMLCAVMGLSAVGCSAGPPPARSPAGPSATAAAKGLPQCGVPQFQASLLARVNAVRAKGANCGSAGRFGPAGRLTWNDALARAAERHTQDMVAGNFFSHTGSAGTELRQRADAAGYRWRTLAENIAGGRETVNGVVDQWLASPGHCANLLNATVVHMGVACVQGGPRNTYSHYWTMALGAPLR